MYKYGSEGGKYGQGLECMNAKLQGLICSMKVIHMIRIHIFGPTIANLE